MNSIDPRFALFSGAEQLLREDALGNRGRGPRPHAARSALSATCSAVLQTTNQNSDEQAREQARRAAQDARGAARCAEVAEGSIPSTHDLHTKPPVDGQSMPATTEAKFEPNGFHRSALTSRRLREVPRLSLPYGRWRRPHGCECFEALACRCVALKPKSRPH